MGTNDAGGFANPGDPGAPGPGSGGGYPGQPSSYSGYREGVHGEPVPESAWQTPDPTAYQQPYPGA